MAEAWIPPATAPVHKSVTNTVSPLYWIGRYSWTVKKKISSQGTIPVPLTFSDTVKV